MKEWYIRVHRAAEGPFSIEDLLRDSRVNEKTFAWKRGMSAWAPIELIPELAPLFKKEGRVQRPKFSDPLAGEQNGGEGILTMAQDPFYFYLLLVIILLLITYISYELYY